MIILSVDLISLLFDLFTLISNFYSKFKPPLLITTSLMILTQMKRYNFIM